ncbi:WAS/WASL-interacting protein family member 3-like [Acropora muricata]|uniref:WAS/WASL-interacting protein family member 3-like n=1 Tax=Acropora muricata TaxID=159855 RepID=UPI0034E4BA28
MGFLGLLVIALFSIRAQASLFGSCPGRCSPQCYPSCSPVCCYTAQRSALFQQELLQRRPQQQQQLQQQFYFRPQVQSAPSPAQYLQTFPAAGSAPSFALARAPSPAPSPAPPPPSPPPPPCPADCPKECYPRCSDECCVPQPPPMPLYLKRKQSVAVACEGHKLKIKCPNKYDRIAIYSTFYGRDDNTTCQHKILPSKGHCAQEEQRVNTKLYDLCQGESKCTVAATTSFLGKNNSVICPDVYKYARVIYRCIQHPKIVPVCSLPCHKPYKCFPRCDISCCSPPPPPPPRPVIPLTCPGTCPSKCFPTCSQACCAPPPPPPAPFYYPMPSVAQAVTSRCPGPCPTICAPLCSVRCCIVHSVAQENSVRPLTFSSPQISTQATTRYRNYYPAARQNNYKTFYRQYGQYKPARSENRNPYSRYQVYRKPATGNWQLYQNFNGYRYQG